MCSPPPIAEPPQRVRVPLDAKKRPITGRFLCLSPLDHRTIVDDFYKVVEFVEWLKENHPDKASYHISKM